MTPTIVVERASAPVGAADLQRLAVMRGSAGTGGRFSL